MYAFKHMKHILLNPETKGQNMQQRTRSMNPLTQVLQLVNPRNRLQNICIPGQKTKTQENSITANFNERDSMQTEKDFTI